MFKEICVLNYRLFCYLYLLKSLWEHFEEQIWYCPNIQTLEVSRSWTIISTTISPFMCQLCPRWNHDELTRGCKPRDLWRKKVNGTIEINQAMHFNRDLRQKPQKWIWLGSSIQVLEVSNGHCQSQSKTLQLTFQSV